MPTRANRNRRTVPTYTWDSASDLLSFADAGGTVSYGYNAVNQVTTATQPGGSQITFTYDAKYNRTATNYPNGVSLAMTYDASNRLTSIVGKKPASGTILTSFTYTYADANGVDRALRQSVTDKDGNKTAYSYDIVNRLTEARTTSSGGTQTADYQYVYDGNGNRTSQVVNGATTSYSYNSANELTSDGTTSYSYDANGNQTAGRTALVYNAKDQTSSVGGTAMTYTSGNQYQRTQAGTATYTNSILGLTREGTTSYTRDPGGTLLGERTATTTTSTTASAPPSRSPMRAATLPTPTATSPTGNSSHRPERSRTHGGSLAARMAISTLVRGCTRSDCATTTRSWVAGHSETSTTTHSTSTVGITTSTLPTTPSI